MESMNIRVIETVCGNKPQEQIEFLELTCNGQTRHIVAYNKGNGYIKLFTYQQFFNFFSLDNDYLSEDISMDLYNCDEEFDSFVYELFFKHNK